MPLAERQSPGAVRLLGGTHERLYHPQVSYSARTRMRLINHILEQGYYGVGAAVNQHMDASRVNFLLAAATQVDIQNVFQYYWSLPDSHEHRVKTLPPLMRLPWPQAWFEWTSPSEGPNKPTIRMGALVLSHVVDGQETQVMNVFTLMRGRSEARLWGQISTKASDKWLTEDSELHIMPDLDADMVGGLLREAQIPVALAIAFAHCKNVTTVDHETPPKVAKKRQKKGQPVGTTYKTLVIDGMKEILRTQGNVEKNGIRKAFHLCRGHFATYTEDKPLFGKVTGTFWKPMHVRGNKQEGEVKKDYSIMPVKD